MNIDEMVEKLENMGYDCDVWYKGGNKEVGEIDSIFLFPRFNRNIGVFEVDGRAVDEIVKAGFRVEHITFFGVSKPSIQFKKVEDVGGNSDVLRAVYNVEHSVYKKAGGD
jgi:hypothetical protein